MLGARIVLNSTLVFNEGYSRLHDGVLFVFGEQRTARERQNAIDARRAPPPRPPNPNLTLIHCIWLD